ncbi:MAG: peptidase C69 [Bacteroides sp. SM1_62]|nr:MAG: peptidase C69 [Bacteroides sp. SM1_62]
MKRLFQIMAILAVSALSIQEANTCTNLLVTRGASVNGATMITYAADAHFLYGELYYRPAADHPAGSLVKIYEWDTGKYLGKIKQVTHTYALVGLMNEHQLAIGETTYGGRPELVDTTGIIDYGSLMILALQRAKTSRGAIQVMGDLVAEYGYNSSGESFSIADKNEVWIMDLIGKGTGNKGAVWVARRIPDGYVSAHANQARIRTFPLDDPENCLYAEDVISFAREQGYFDGKDKDFSFSDTYAPVDFGGARFCEARVWSFFSKVTEGMEQYLDYAKGENLENRMPLWVKPSKKLAARDLMNYMRDHFEGTPLDMTQDVGAGPYRLPYRWRPLTWSVGDVTYCNERAIATQQTGYSFVTESRNWLPDWIGGIFWFGVDDAATTVYNPMYCGIDRVPEPFEVGNGDMITYSETSAFWAFNFVANFCYLRYDLMTEDVKKVQAELESKYINNSEAIDKAALALYNKDPEQARKFLTDYSVGVGEQTFKRWKELGQYLLVKYIDGNVKKERDGKFIYNGFGGNIPPDPDQPGYPAWWYEKIAEDKGDQLKVIGDAH